MAGLEFGAEGDDGRLPARRNVHFHALRVRVPDPEQDEYLKNHLSIFLDNQAQSSAQTEKITRTLLEFQILKKNLGLLYLEKIQNRCFPDPTKTELFLKKNAQISNF